MKIERVVEIAGTPILVTGEAKLYKGWMISPALYTTAGGLKVDTFLLECEEIKTLCNSMELARRWIARREKQCRAERP